MCRPACVRWLKWPIWASCSADRSCVPSPEALIRPCRQRAPEGALFFACAEREARYRAAGRRGIPGLHVGQNAGSPQSKGGSEETRRCHETMAVRPRPRGAGSSVPSARFQAFSPSADGLIRAWSAILPIAPGVPAQAKRAPQGPLFKVRRGRLQPPRPVL